MRAWKTAVLGIFAASSVSWHIDEGAHKRRCDAQRACGVDFACRVEAGAEEGLCEAGCFSNADCPAERPACMRRDSKTGLGLCMDKEKLPCMENEECFHGQVCKGATKTTLGACRTEAFF